MEVKADGLYLDGTFGGGGHSRAILEAGGQVFAMDRDKVVVPILEGFEVEYGNRFSF